MSSSIIPKEHDYIGGLSGTTSSPESISDKLSSSSSSPSATLAKLETQVQNISSCLKETELRLGLPGSESPDRVVNRNFCFVSGAKRGFSHVDLNAQADSLFSSRNGDNDNVTTHKTSAALSSKQPVLEKNNTGVNENTSSAPAAKAQVVGWPPIRSFRKNSMASNAAKNSEDAEGKSGSGCLYVKVSMDGAPYLRKVDLKTYANYVELSSGLEKMFSCFTIGQCGTHGLRGRDGLTETCLKDLLHGSEYVLTYEDKDGDWMLVGDVPWDMFTDTCRRLRIMKGSEAIGLAPRTMEKSRSRN